MIAVAAGTRAQTGGIALAATASVPGAALGPKLGAGVGIGALGTAVADTGRLAVTSTVVCGFAALAGKMLT